MGFSKQNQHAYQSVLGKTIRSGFTVLTAMATIIISVNTAQADCERHIYNNSSQDWEVQCVGRDGWSGFTGNALGGCESSWFLRIPAGQTKLIEYTCGWKEGYLQFLSADGKYDRMFKVGFDVGCAAGVMLDDCVYLRHSGNTGRAVLNDPANGDVKLIN